MRPLTCKLLLVLCVLAAYSGTFDAPFVFDDFMTVQRHSGVRFGGVDILTPRGITYKSYELNLKLLGPYSSGLHIVNAGLHSVNAVLAYSVLANITPYPLVGAVLFALHPIQTESVSYISGRSELLAGLFVMLALLFSRFALLFMGLGILSKENAVILPALACFYSAYESRVWPLFAGLGVGLYWTWGAVGEVTRNAHILWSSHLAQLPYTWAYYAQNTLYPRLNVDPDIRDVSGWSFVPLLVIIAAGLYTSRESRYGLFWCAICLSPYLLPIMDPIAEHRMYLPMLGIGLIASELTHRLIPLNQATVVQFK